ncbi:type I restriction endonuclease subunit R [Variovorax sp. KK3]|uniref:type I restriction endonuclease subunit R n=1 Tax=Variovorax sp. KK3 TaxID=1855728 RepID=UPI00097C7F9F|nr:HsdR family type I site-specific deoxyribonuclease [Variovorax sp. KK3]
MTDSASAPEVQNARISALRVMCNLGWNFLSTDDASALRGTAHDVLLKARLIEVLLTRRFDYKGVSHPLSPSAIDQILRELSTVGLGDGLLAANERLYGKLASGITVTEFMPDGRRHQPTISVIDWHDASANRFDVTERMGVLSGHATHYRTVDIVGYVNGIPLVTIEIGRPRRGGQAAEARMHDGIDRQLRNQLDAEIAHLYVYAQLLMAVGSGRGCYGTTATPARLWARWHEEEGAEAEEGFDDASIHALKNAALPVDTRAALLRDATPEMRERFESQWSLPTLADGQDKLIISLLSPRRLLELRRGFVLFDGRVGKIVARHHQFFAVRALLRHLDAQRPDGSRQGGVVWHSAGSGKSFTMVFLAKALLLHERLKECRLVVITDRRELERQLARNFMAGNAFGAAAVVQQEIERSQAVSGRDLAQRIGHGTKRIMFALVQKFSIASRLPECRNDSADLVVLVDEAHRSHGGETHERMRKALPRAACVAFTATPLLKDEKTTEKFGPIVRAYTMRRAIEDHAVVPLLYEERVIEPGTDIAGNWFDTVTSHLAPAQRAALKAKFAARVPADRAPDRIDLIAWDIALHFNARFKGAAPGLKGQIATASKHDAIRYKRALDATGLVTSVVFVSAPDVHEGHSAAGEDGLQEVQAWWQHDVLDQGIAATHYERHVLQAFAGEGSPDLLIVVDRLLTGFDEPRNAVLYIDKPLKGHQLMQAVARVNRLHESKRHGLLVDYRGILKELDTAILAFQDLDNRTQGGFDIDDLDGLYAQFGCAGGYVDYADRRLPLADFRVAEDMPTYQAHAPSMPHADAPAEAAPVLPEAPLQGSRIEACLEVISGVLGDDEKGGLDEARRAQHLSLSMAIGQAVQAAIAEHSLSLQDIEADIRKRLLQLLYAPVGLDKAGRIIEQVIEIARADLGRRA